MNRKSVEELGELQAAVMEAVWELGEASVHQVREMISKRKELAYTTVLSAMQKLEKAGWLAHRAEGRSYFYRATASRGQGGRSSVQRVLQKVFGGDPMMLFRQLLDA